MKKIGILSFVASVYIWGVTVDDLKLDLENYVDQSTINAATVSQGETTLLGEANINDVTIGQKNGSNTISNTIINSTDNLDFNTEDFEQSEYYDRERDETIVSQGRTMVINGDLSKVELRSDNTIDQGTTINTALGNSVKIEQGLTLVAGTGQTLSNAKIVSDNRISDVEIEGDGAGETHIQQAAFIMEEDGSPSTAMNIRIDTTNIIESGKIGHADIRQAVTELEEGAVLEDTILTQDNSIIGETEIKDFSEVSQGTLEVEEDSIASINQAVSNIIADVQGESSSATDSVIKQSDIYIEGGSTVSLSFNEHSNIIRDVELSDSSLTQDVVNVKNHSTVENFKQEADNSVIAVGLSDSEIRQNHMVIDNSILTGDDALVSMQMNMIANSSLTDTFITQADVTIKDSEVKGLTVSEQNSITDSEFYNASLTQGKLFISALE